MTRPCEVCGGERFSVFPNRRKLALSRCEDCRLIRCTSIPAVDELARIYTRGYYQSWGLEKHWPSVERMKRATFRRVLDQLKSFQPAGGNLLDIGCATGFLMQEAASHSWTPYGTELSEFAVQKAQARFGDHVFRGELKDNPFPGVRFEAITLIDLLEHVRYPIRLLQICHERLVPGGVLVIGTPNTESLTSRLFGGWWTHFKEEHLYYFSPRNLERLLKKEGFSVLRTGSMRKKLNVQYISDQFDVYPLPLLGPVLHGLCRILPNRLLEKNFSVTIGEMLVLARRK